MTSTTTTPSAGAARAALPAVAERALAAYAVRPVRVRRLPRGWNASFGVLDADGGRHVLRVHRHDGPDEAMVRSELAWLQALGTGTDLLVPRPHRTRDGDLVAVVDMPPGGGAPAAGARDDVRVCDLLHWVDGRFVDVRLTPAHLRTMGTLMGRLEEHGRRFVRPDGFVRPDVTRWTVLAGPGEDPLGTEVLGRACDALAALGPGWDLGVVRATVGRAREARDDAVARGGTGLLHADLHHENVLFGAGRTGPDGLLPVGAIDFDDCGDGPDAYDPAVMVAELWGRPDRDRLRAALLEGWAAARPPGGPDAGATEQVDAMEGLRHLQLAVYAVEHRAEPMFAEDWHDDLTVVLGRLVGLLR